MHQPFWISICILTLIGRTLRKSVLCFVFIFYYYNLHHIVDVSKLWKPTTQFIILLQTH